MIYARVMRRFGILALPSLLAACLGGSTTVVDDQPLDLTVTEVDDPNYPNVSDRAATALPPATIPTTITVVVLKNTLSTSPVDVSYDQATGLISTGELTGADLDDASFTNPADGEISRVVNISGTDSYFGVVGFGTQSADLPPSGETRYNKGWVSLQAATDTDNYTLEGIVVFIADWDTNDLTGTFAGLDGTASGTTVGGADQPVNDVGTITLSDSTITGNTFAGGTVTGTGIFAGLGPASVTAGTQGAFFGAQADELGGLLVIDGAEGTVDVIGAFQAD